MSIKATLISFFGELGHYLSVLFQESLQKELTVVVPLARGIIAEVAMDPTMLTSSDKRNAAIALIIAQLASKQMQVGQDVIRLAIELAYQDFKISPVVASTVAASTTSKPAA